MIDFSFFNILTYPLITRLMPISIWQKNGLYDIQIGYYFVRKVDSISDRLSEREVSGERIKVKGIVLTGGRRTLLKP
jgi:hypothetical protein